MSDERRAEIVESYKEALPAIGSDCSWGQGAVEEYVALLVADIDAVRDRLQKVAEPLAHDIRQVPANDISRSFRLGKSEALNEAIELLEDVLERHRLTPEETSE